MSKDSLKDQAISDIEKKVLLMLESLAEENRQPADEGKSLRQPDKTAAKNRPAARTGSVHIHHRKRLKKKFLKEGIEHWEPHNVLELLLTYAIPYKDVNETAHELIAAFRSLPGVFEAPFEELIKIKGIKEHSAILLKLMPELFSYYHLQKVNFNDIIFNNTKTIGEIVIPLFLGKTKEMLYAFYLDTKSKLLGYSLISEGIINAAYIEPRKIVSEANKYNASLVILAHNHPNGSALPSHEDTVATKLVADALEKLKIYLLDHIIVADYDFTLMSYSDCYTMFKYNYLKD